MDRIYRRAHGRRRDEPERRGEEPLRCSVVVGVGADCRVEMDAVAVKRS